MRILIGEAYYADFYARTSHLCGLLHKDFSYTKYYTDSYGLSNRGSLPMRTLHMEISLEVRLSPRESACFRMIFGILPPCGLPCELPYRLLYKDFAPMRTLTRRLLLREISYELIQTLK